MPTTRIGYLGSAPVDALMAVFVRRLQELGYTEGISLIVIPQSLLTRADEPIQ